jgi:hypothetical protein
MPALPAGEFFSTFTLAFMAIKKTEPKNLELYTRLMSAVPEADIKGNSMPYTSINGNMYSFLKDGSAALRLAEDDRRDFIKKFKSKLFETLGTVMTEYVTVSPALLKNTKELRPFVKKSFGYAKTLKAKPTKKK